MIVTWAQLDVLDKYNFNSIEKETIQKINKVKDLNIYDKHVLYDYGLYICSMVCELKGEDKKKLNEIYVSIPIKSKLDIALKPMEICEILNKKAGNFLKDLIKNLENQIIDGKIENTKEAITEYLKSVS